MLTNINKLKHICLFVLIGMIVAGCTCLSLLSKAADSENPPHESSTTTTSATTSEPSTTVPELPDDPDIPDNPQPKNIKICIDAGHGWNDPGTISGSHYEKDIDLEIAKHMRDALVSMGYEVIMLRESDDIPSPAGMASDGICNITRRVSWVNGQDDIDLMVSIHCDSIPSSPATYGTRIYYMAERFSVLETLGNEIKSFLFNEGVVPKSPLIDNNSSRLYSLAAAKMPAILVECGFMTSPYDLRVLTDADFQELYGITLAKAVNSYFDILKR